MELRDQLQAALGSGFVIERELGGGGMSRVFAATETALGRRVVVKVVPLELGAGVNVDRFKREILLAASLQHPHIVPVLTAGEMDGVPYYTMPFVEGESLRAQLARGPMPIAQVVGILRDVSKALGYAHERGVVHRDIKPDNVLLTGGSAAVIDFGIAKAISASRASETGATLTQVGTSIGTPTYMAPEQAAADPSADHRADIYSFGCMAYELLAGRPPFAGLSPHKMLAAHMGERPQPIAELRTDTPPLLATLVMQCLEKDPEARPQSAADLSRVLDAVTSGVSHDALPSLTASGPRALSRALVMYALAFVAVVVLAKAAVVGIGLPDWVMPASVTLMSLGLPLILATAFVQRVARRAFVLTPRPTAGGAAVTQSTVTTLALKASPHLSWKRTSTIGVWSIGAFVAAVGLFMALRAAGVGPFASLLGAGKLNDKDKILVADFTASADSTLGAVVAEAVRADLGQSPILSIVTPQAVAAALQRMQRPANTRVDTAVAREIARREGIKAVVTGDIHSLPGGGFVVTMRLVSADSGQELASLSEGADGGKELIPTIGKLTHRLRGKMGESLKHLQSSAELAQVTTSSLPALQKYTAASRAMSVELDYDRAIPLFKEAIALDTTFGSAYRALAIALGNSGRDRALQIASLEKAYAHSDRLPEAEAYLARASYWTNGPKPDRAKARAEYEALLAIRPTQYAALNNLGLLVADSRDFARAEELMRRSIAANPQTLVAYGNLMAYQAEQGKLAAMDSTFAAQLKVSGGNPRTVLGRANLLYMRGEYDATDAFVDSLAKAHPSELDLEMQRVNVRASTAVTRGKVSEGLRLASQGVALSAKRGIPTALLGAAIDSAVVQALFFGEKEKALALVQAGLKRKPLDSIPPLSRPYASLAQVYAMAGRADLARAMLAEFERNVGSTLATEIAAASRHGIQSTIALAEKRYLDAAHEAQASDRGSCTACVLPVIGMAYDLAQMPDSAIDALTRFVTSTSIINRFNSDQFFRAASLKRLGELWEAKGDRAKAAGYYAKFVELWKDADPELQPQVADVRKRLAKLGGAS